MTDVLTRPPDATRGGRDRRLLSLVGSACALVAAAIHAAVVPEHLAEARAVGAFFVVLAVLQVALAVSMLRALQPSVLALALIGHVGVVMLYVASRTMDLAFLPTHAGHHLPVADGAGNGEPALPGSLVEPVGVPDLACLAAELVLITVLAAMLPARASRVLTNGLAALALAAVVARGLGLVG